MKTNQTIFTLQRFIEIARNTPMMQYVPAVLPKVKLHETPMTGPLADYLVRALGRTLLRHTRTLVFCILGTRSISLDQISFENREKRESWLELSVIRTLAFSCFLVFFNFKLGSLFVPRSLC
jgi:hypothetical protein